MNKLYRVKESRSWLNQLLSYAFIGILSNLTGYLLYLIITHFGMTPKLTMTFLYGFGMIVSYIANRKYTFSHTGKLLRSSFRFFLAHCFGYMINFTILIIFVDQLGHKHQVVQAIAIFIVAFYLFITFKLFVFSSSNKANMEKS